MRHVLPTAALVLLAAAPAQAADRSVTHFAVTGMEPTGWFLCDVLNAPAAVFVGRAGAGRQGIDRGAGEGQPARRRSSRCMASTEAIRARGRSTGRSNAMAARRAMSTPSIPACTIPPP